MAGRARATAAALVGMLLLVTAACGGDDGGGGRSSGLPRVEDEPVLHYRILYQVTTPGGSGTEELRVRRPFDAHVVERRADGSVAAEQWSRLGALVSRTGDEDPVGLAVAAAPALGDTRLHRFGPELVAAGKLTQGDPGTVGGRACTNFSATTTAAALPPGAEPGLDEAEAIAAVVERCVDAHGIVLEERWTTPNGRRLRTKRATELEVGGDLDLDLEPPRAEPAGGAAGGSFEPLEGAGPDLPAPVALDGADDLTSLGRFLVRPPRLGTAGSVGDARLELVTEVWVRGPDLVVLDQGVGTGGATPFDDRLTWRPIELATLGPAELGGDARMAEVRLRRPDGRFVRLAGTIPVAELEALAARLGPAGVGP